MASEMSKLLKRAVDAYTDEMAREEDKKTQIALERTMDRIKEKIEEYIEWMSTAYYEGYDPVRYVRSMQLQRKDTRPVNPYAEIKETGGISNLSFGVIFDESTMNHGSYTIKAKWYDKKNKKWKDVKKNKTYTVTPGKKGGKKPNEKTILKFFQAGIHPNAVLEGVTDFPTPIPLFTNNREGVVPAMIEAWIEGDPSLSDNELQRIFYNELSKLHK